VKLLFLNYCFCIFGICAKYQSLLYHISSSEHHFSICIESLIPKDLDVFLAKTALAPIENKVKCPKLETLLVLLTIRSRS
jgi:hypothetical protein